MAFSFANAASGGAGFASTTNTSGGVNMQDGPELQEIQTNELGFAALNGESKVQVIPTPWPADDLPSPTSSLLSIASTKKLLAAAGPDALYLSSTDKLRDAFRSSPPSVDETTRPFTAEIRIPQPRLSQVTFSSDESALVVSRANDGGILGFQVDHIVDGRLDPAVQISTNGQSLRALVPNPVPDSAELFAAITSNGELLLFNLRAGSMVSGSNGTVLTSGATCLSWSNRGKQLVAGMADGTAVQMKPDGTIVAQIPKSTSIPAGVHVSGISWLENDTFFVTYTPNDTSNGIQPSEYYIINRDPKPANYTFHKLPEVLPPFGVERLPTSHFISRLRNFAPHLLDLLIVTATTASDIGLISKVDKPLSQEDQITSAFTFTTIEDDTRRAQLPLSSDMQDTSPIGMALDLSSTENVPNPLPSDAEILETAGPVPGLMILNNTGVLVAWWIIYNDSVREKTTYSGFAAVQAARQSQGNIAPSPSPSLAAPTNTVAQNSNVSPFAKPTASGFGAPAPPTFGTSSPITSDKPSWAATGFGSHNNAATNGSAFGKAAFSSATAIGSTAPPAFGSATPIGGSRPAFGSATPVGGSAAPAFGSATPIGGSAAPAFGSSSALGNRPSPFGQPAAIGGASAFGQPSPLGAISSTKPFANDGGASNSSGFASFSKGGGFSSFAAQNKTDQNSGSPFGTATGRSIFGQPTGTKFGADKPAASPWQTNKPVEGQNSFGTGESFKLDSSFRGDGSARDDLPKPKDSGGFGFGTSFGDMLGDSRSPLSPTHDKETDMDEESAASDDSSENRRMPTQGFSSQASNKPAQTLVTPPATLAQSKTTPAPPVSSLFGHTPQDTTTPQPQTTTPGWTFGAVPSTTPKETPLPAHMSLFGNKGATNEAPTASQRSETVNAFQGFQPTPKIKEEPPSEEGSVDLNTVPEAPLPPDAVSKPPYAASGDTSLSSNMSKSPPDDAPLPPDFVPTRQAGNDLEPHQELPSEDEDEDDDDDDFSSDFGDSGEELEKDASDEHHEQPQTSPESSFKSGDRSPEISPTGGLFTKVSSTTVPQKPARPLFGEVTTGPIFAPPKPQESPRSPSPVRNILSVEGLRVEPSRSVSAPAHPRSIVDQRKAEYQQSALATQAAKMREDEVAKEKTRREAIARQRAQQEAEQLQLLEDDMDDILRAELERPVSPTQSLDEFITYQPNPSEETNKTGIPAQIERLYSDINSMVYTLGINCRSLSAFMQYQQPEANNNSWPSVLMSETPMDALNDEWFLSAIVRLHEGQGALSTTLAENHDEAFSEKIQECQSLIGRDLFELRTKLTSIRKTIHALSTSGSAITAPLSAEQSSIQHDLRKAFTAVQAKLVQVEDCLSVLRAKVAQSTPAETISRRSSVLGRAPSQKKPSVEAVTKTVVKMMSMAEQKSADIDVLEAQLKKLDISSPSAVANGDGHKRQPHNTTPLRGRRSLNAATPDSTGSIYHTPGSQFGQSARSNRSFRTSQNGGLLLITAEDKGRWQSRLHRRKQVASILKDLLEEKRKALGAKK